MAAWHVAPDMTAQGAAATLWALAQLTSPARSTLDSLEAVLERTAGALMPSSVAQALSAFATLDVMPADSLVDALEAAVWRSAPAMKAPDVADAFQALASLQLDLEPPVLYALEAAADRSAPVLDADSSSKLLLAYAAMDRRPPLRVVLAAARHTQFVGVASEGAYARESSLDMAGVSELCTLPPGLKAAPPNAPPKLLL